MNEFIVWDKLSTNYGFGKVIELKENGNIKVELRDENGKEFYKYRRQCDVSFHRPIGKTDINNKKIYADCSIVKITWRSGVEEIGYFSYSKKKLAYLFNHIFVEGKDLFCDVLMEKVEIIDNIQENKLGLIKEVEKVNNGLDLEDLKYFPSCSSCGAEYTTQEDVDTLIYSRTTANADLYYCTECKEESIQI